MDAKKIYLDNRCLGKEMLCVGVAPYYDYDANGQRSKILGQAYDICLPDHAFDHIRVKVQHNEPQIEVPEGGYVPVVLTDLVVRPYVGRDGRLAYTASASGIKAVPNKG